MTEPENPTAHLHATFIPAADMDGGLVVVMRDPDVTECGCKPAPCTAVTCPAAYLAPLPWRTDDD